MYIVYVKW